MPSISNSFASMMRGVTGGAFGRSGQASKPRIPQGMTDAQDAQRTAHPDPVRYDGRDMPFGNTSRHFLPPGGATAWSAKQKARPDAGNACIGAENASMHVLTYCYGTHKPMEAWLQDPPQDGKLLIKMAISPSSHAGSSPADKKENYKKFALTNTYNIKITYPDGKSETKQFKVNGKTPEYSTLSPEIEIDLDQYAGKDITIDGWANGSAGVGGYPEKRRTVLHVPE